MQILEKRSSDSRRFDIDCSLLLNVGETISSVSSSSASPATTPPIVFGTPVINPSQTTYTDAWDNTRTVPAGQVIQVQISGGAIPSTARTQRYTLRFVLATSQNPAIEATVVLNLNDTPT
jgi:hypothetical protein